MKNLPKVKNKFLKNTKENDFSLATKKIVTAASLSLALLASSNAISATDLASKLDQNYADKIELLKKNDLIIDKATTNVKESGQYAYHQSHYSHYSHRSHYSHYSSRY